MDQDSETGAPVEGIELEEVRNAYGARFGARLDDQPQLTRAEKVAALQLRRDEPLHLGPREGLGRAAHAPHGGVVLPCVEQLRVLRFHGPEPDDAAFEVHQMPITLLRISMATPHAFALSVIFETRNLVSL